MAIKSGDLIHVGDQILVDRLQTAGPGTLNQPQERIYELGDYQSVGVIRDIPDLTFTAESFDASAELEAILCGLGSGFGAAADGTLYDCGKMFPLDVLSEFKKGRLDAAPFDVAGSVALPYLTVESLSYRFGLKDNARQTVTLRGDSIFYAEASAYQQLATGTATANQVVTLAHAPIVYNGDLVAGPRYALSVSLKSGKRLVLGTDYTETATAVTVLAPVPTTDKIKVVYQSAVVANYPQASHALSSAIHPAAIKGKDIEVRVGGVTLSDRWTSVQSVTADWKVTLDKDEEFGNSQFVSQDYDVPAVSGAVDLKPRSFSELMTRIYQIANVTPGEVAGPFTSQPLELEILLHSNYDGSVIKTLYCPDARFTLPAFSGRVQQKLTTSFPFESESGNLYVYKGTKP
jgi:hypothetical protein